MTNRIIEETLSVKQCNGIDVDKLDGESLNFVIEKLQAIYTYATGLGFTNLKLNIGGESYSYWIEIEGERFETQQEKQQRTERQEHVKTALESKEKKELERLLKKYKDADN